MALQRLTNEAELLDGVAKGDERAFGQLFHGYYNQLGEFVQLLTHDRECTLEIIQEVFAKIWINRESLPMVQKFDAYLFILCRNHTLNHIRRRAVEREKFDVYLREMGWEEGSEVMGETGTGQLSYELLERAVQMLPPQQQKVLSLRLQGLKNPEISKQLNLPIDSVKKYQYLAKRFVSELVKTGIIVSAIVAVFLGAE